MIVNDLVKTIGYTRDKLKYFEFYICNKEDDFIGFTIKDISADDYISFCDKEVYDWICDTHDAEGNCICTVTIALDSEEFCYFYQLYNNR